MDATREQITKLREAVEKDKAIKEKHEVHLRHLDALQKKELELEKKISNLQERLKKIKEDIVVAIKTEFDYSDDMTIAAAEETANNLEKKLDDEETYQKYEKLDRKIQTENADKKI